MDSLSVDPNQGESLGKNCYKIRVAITSKGKGKSGGARLITCVKILKNKIYLLDIYDKSEQSDISGEELLMLVNMLAE